MADLELGESRSARSRSIIQDHGESDIINPEVLQHRPRADPRFGIFGRDAIIWTLSRTKEIGLCKGKPRAAARLIVVKNLFDNSKRELLLKRLPYRDEHKLKRFWLEIETHRHVCLLGGSDYICHFYGVRNCPTRKSADGRPIIGKLDYVMELGSEGDILSYIQNQWKKFTTITTREAQKAFLANHVANTQRIIAQIACAVKQCFDAKIVHFDLKLENVVMTKILEEDRERYKSRMSVNGREFDWCVKLIDFGLARHFVGNNWTYREGRKGTPRYMAPEIAAGNRNIQNARSADIWPVGIMLWECLAGLPLWKEAKPDVKIYNEMLKAGSFKEWFDQLCSLDQNRHFPQFVPRQAADLLDGIFRPDPNRRYSIERILAHDFLKPQVPTSLGSGRSMIDETMEKKYESKPALRLMPSISGKKLSNKKLKTIKNINMMKADQLSSGDVEDQENEVLPLTQQQAREVIPEAIRRRQSVVRKCNAIGRWFYSWGLYTFCLLGYVIACPCLMFFSGFWDLHAYWSFFVGGVPLILCLFFYHIHRGLQASSNFVSVSEGSHFKSTVSQTVWNVGFKPLVTVLSQLSTLAIALMWIYDKSWTNENRSSESGEDYNTYQNGYFILAVLIMHQLLSALFFYLRAGEMEKLSHEKEDSSTIKIFLAQLFGLQLFWDVESASRIRRQTGLIREHKIVEGILNSCVTFLLIIYYYFEMSIGVGYDGATTHPTSDVVKELSWLCFAGLLSLLSVSLVLNMGDFVGVSVEKSRCGQALVDVCLIIFRITEVSLRVCALAMFAACINVESAIYICICDFIVVFLLSYCNIFSVTTNRFEFEKNAGVIHQTVKTAFSAMYGVIAMPLLDQRLYGFGRIILDGLLIFGAWEWKSDDITLWDEPQTLFMVYIGVSLFFLLGIITYFVFDWEQYNQVMRVKAEVPEDEQVAKIIQLCWEKPALLNRFLVSGVLRVATVRALAVQNWEEYGKTRDWLKNNGFYDLLEYSKSSKGSDTFGMMDTGRSSMVRKKTVDEKKEVVESGPKDVCFEPDGITTKLIQPSSWQESHQCKAKCLCMAVSPDGQHLAVGLEDSPYLKVLELPSLKLVMDLRAGPYVGAVTGVEFRRPAIGALELITVAEDARMRIFQPLSNSKPTKIIPICSMTSDLKKTTHKIRCLAMDYSESNFAVGVGIDIWLKNTEDEKEFVIGRHEDVVTAIKFFPTGEGRLLTCSVDRTVRIWHNQGAPFYSSTLLDWGKWKGNNDEQIVRTLDISASGSVVACGYINGFVLVWEQTKTDSWEVVSRINMGGWVEKIDFLPENYGSLLVVHTRPTQTAGLTEDEQWMSNGYSAVWDYRAGTCNFALVQPKNAIRSSCILQKRGGLKLITGSWSAKDEHFVLLWDLDKHIHDHGKRNISG